MRRISLLLALLLGSLSGLPAVQAAPVRTECAGDDSDLGRLLDALRSAVGLSAADRTQKIEELFALLADPELAASNDCAKKQPRYDAAAALVKLVESAPASDRAKLYACLTKVAAQETDPLLRRQLGLELDRLRPRSGMPPEARALVEEALPTRPPYEAIFGKDGKDTAVNMTIHTAKEVMRTSPYIRAFRAAGATIVKTTPSDWTVTMKVTPDDPTGRLAPITYTIRIVDQYDDAYENLDVFRDMSRPDPQIEMYDFHAQYGAALDESVRNATPNPDARKLFLNVACKSKTMANRAAALFPKTHFVNTTDGEYFSDSPYMVTRMLKGLANRETYAQMRRAMAVDDLTNYQMPDDKRQLDYLDLDRDGIADANDRALACSRVAAPNIETFDPRAPVDDPALLDGEKVLRAVSVANGIMGYNLAVGPRWEDKFVADGFGPADPNGPIAIYTRGNVAAGRTRVTVKINGAYSHLDDMSLTAALSRDFTLYGATNGHPERATLNQKINAFETGVDLLTAWWGEDLFAAYQAKFPLPKSISWSQATNALDAHDGSTATTVAKIRALVN